MFSKSYGAFNCFLFCGLNFFEKFLSWLTSKLQMERVTRLRKHLNKLQSLNNKNFLIYALDQWNRTFAFSGKGRTKFVDRLDVILCNQDSQEASRARANLRYTWGESRDKSFLDCEPINRESDTDKLTTRELLGEAALIKLVPVVYTCRNKNKKQGLIIIKLATIEVFYECCKSELQCNEE